MSDDALTEVNDVTFTKLQERHLHSDESRRNFPMLLHIKAFLQESESEFKAPHSSFPTGFAGDPNGPQHVSDLLNCLEVGPTLLTEITIFLIDYFKVIVRQLFYQFYSVEI